MSFVLFLGHNAHWIYTYHYIILLRRLQRKVTQSPVSQNYGTTREVFNIKTQKNQNFSDLGLHPPPKKI